jgi:hypothetical protein
MGTKVFKSDSEATAGLTVSSKLCRMHSNKENYVLVDDKGITIDGPISIVSGSSQVRYSALWTMNTETLLTLPSTMATPTPVMTINLPVKQIASLIEEASVMIGLFSMI